MDIKDWHDFFIATAGSAAALTGLIFVGVSINIAKILSSPKLPDRAWISLILLLNILIVSILILIPQQSFFTIGIENLVIALTVYIMTVTNDVTIYKNTEPPYKQRYRIHVILNQLAVFPYLIAAATILMGNENGLYWMVPGIAFSFIKAVLDAWVLLVEINR